MPLPGLFGKQSAQRLPPPPPHTHTRSHRQGEAKSKKGLPCSLMGLQRALGAGLETWALIPRPVAQQL